MDVLRDFVFVLLLQLPLLTHYQHCSPVICLVQISQAINHAEVKSVDRKPAVIDILQLSFRHHYMSFSPARSLEHVGRRGQWNLDSAIPYFRGLRGFPLFKFPASTNTPPIITISYSNVTARFENWKDITFHHVRWQNKPLQRERSGPTSCPSRQWCCDAGTGFEKSWLTSMDWLISA